MTVVSLQVVQAFVSPGYSETKTCGRYVPISGSEKRKLFCPACYPSTRNCNPSHKYIWKAEKQHWGIRFEWRIFSFYLQSVSVVVDYGSEPAVSVICFVMGESARNVLTARIRAGFGRRFLCRLQGPIRPVWQQVAVATFAYAAVLN